MRSATLISKYVVVVVLLIIVTGCLGKISTDTSLTKNERQPSAIPTLDTGRHNVPLEEIAYDTYRLADGPIPLDEASPELIAEARTLIPVLHDPRYQSADEATWLGGEDLVVGYAAGDQAWAYPLRILNYHVLLNDTLAGEPVLVSYCALCFSGVVFSRRRTETDQVLTFQNAGAIYESDIVMYDEETGSYWYHVAGEAIVGPLTGTTLEVLPSNTLSWLEWRQLHPDTRVLSRETGYDRDYNWNPFLPLSDVVAGTQFRLAQVASTQPQISPTANVIVVQLNGTVRAYPLLNDRRAAYNDTLAGQEIVVFTHPDGATGAAYRSNLGQPLTFEVRNGSFVDRETESIWAMDGRAVDGPYTGEQLSTIAEGVTRWFMAVATEPALTVYNGPIE